MLVRWLRRIRARDLPAFISVGAAPISSHSAWDLKLLPKFSTVHFDPSRTMLEADVGICEWTNTLPGFTGILKQRYSDFKVNELTAGGEVVRLTSILPITKPANKPLQHEAEDKSNATSVPANSSTAASATSLQDEYPQESVDAALADFAALAGEENAAIVRPYVAAVLGRNEISDQPVKEIQNAPQEEPLETTLDSVVLQSSATAAELPAAAEDAALPPKRWPPRVVLNPILEKELRTKVHQFFREETRIPVFRTETAQERKTKNGVEPSTGAIDVVYQRTATKKRRQGGSDNGGGGKRRRTNTSDEWPGGFANQYLRFVLHKENMDTQAALGVLARGLHTPQHKFGFCGTKDKRGITEQAVTIPMVNDQRVAGLNKYLRGIQVGSFSYIAQPLGLGAAGGNQFEVTLRAVEGAPPPAVILAVEALSTGGFVNYFGLQRFGSDNSSTHMVGAQLLKGEWEAAVRMLMRGHMGDSDAVAAARKAFLEGGDIKAALLDIPRFMTAEHAVLTTLQRLGPRSFLPALESIPRTLRTMYLHAWQSFLWNFAASHRIQTFGASSVVVGDLVLPHNATPAAPPLDEFGMEVAEGADAGADRAAIRLTAVHTVTASEVTAGTYCIADVVLPLPGSRIRYPEHSTAEVYTSMADKQGISLESCPHGCRGFALTALAGDYRHLVQVPKKLAWRLLKYQNPNVDLSLVAAEGSPGVMVQQASNNWVESNPPPVEGVSPAAPQPTAVASEADKSPDLMALQLRFQLPPSAYATMLVRQATKSSTAKSAHRDATRAAQDEAR